MNIAILGTGAMGRSLAARLTQSGYTVIVGSREPARANAVASEHGAQCGSLRGAAEAADVIFLAALRRGAQNLASAGALDGKIVVDITNPLNADFSGLTIGHTTSAAETIQAAFPKTRGEGAQHGVCAADRKPGDQWRACLPPSSPETMRTPTRRFAPFSSAPAFIRSSQAS